MGVLTGKPETSGLYKHPLFNSGFGIPIDESGRLDDEVQPISPQKNAQLHKKIWSKGNLSKRISSFNWHSDTPFEPVTSDYAILKMIDIPGDTGGDTLWASCYEAYDRLSPHFQKLIEGLTCTNYNKYYDGMDYIKDPRGAPENIGYNFKAVQYVCFLPFPTLTQSALRLCPLVN